SSILYLNLEFGYQFVITILAEIKTIHPVVLSGMVAPALFHFQHVFARNPSDHRYLFSTFVANNFFQFFRLSLFCTILAHLTFLLWRFRPFLSAAPTLYLSCRAFPS